MAKKKKTAKKKAAKKRSRRRTAQINSTLATGREGQAADLAEVLRKYGVDPRRIPEAIVAIRGVSDAQSGDGPPPPAPTPAPIDSRGELNGVSAAEHIVAETTRIDTQTQPEASGQASDPLDECRLMLLALECEVIQGLPRTSFVGRAIHIRTNGRPAGTSYVDIYEVINRENDQLLPDRIREALRVTRDGPEGETREQRRRMATSASSALRSNLNPRIRVLADRLRYVEVIQGGQAQSYRLTTFAQQVFNRWPPWREPDAIPNADAEAAPEEPASGPATEPT